MPRKKAYAAWFPGRESEAVFFDSWESCQAYVNGLPNVRYRGFPELEEAKDFLGLTPLQDQEDPNLFQDQKAEEDLTIYVDGSYIEGYPHAGWAWVALASTPTKPKPKRKRKDTLIGEGRGVTPDPAVSRNIDGELLATMEAVRWVEDYLAKRKLIWSKTRVVIHYDYAGIGEWAQGNWKAKTPLTQHYQQKMAAYRHRIEFKKVSSHTGNYWNEYVDRRAKEAVLADNIT